MQYRGSRRRGTWWYYLPTAADAPQASCGGNPGIRSANVATSLPLQQEKWVAGGSEPVCSVVRVAARPGDYNPHLEVEGSDALGEPSALAPPSNSKLSNSYEIASQLASCAAGMSHAAQPDGEASIRPAVVHNCGARLTAVCSGGGGVGFGVEINCSSGCRWAPLPTTC
jgi:hypothetical protein